MAETSSAEKVKLTITACSVDSSGDITVDKGKSFEFALNPSAYDHSYAIEYNKKTAIGQSGSDARFSGVKPEKLKITTLIDGTGAVGSADSPPVEVKSELKKLREIVYNYDGDKHEPNYVRVLWGSQIFYGRLESMTYDSTLFKPSGEPLRVKIQLAFTGYMSKQEEAARANRSSPDMSRLIEVQAGDTLPLLCYRVYRDSSYYPEIARLNGITDFRNIEPGSKIHFPPLR